jgi:catecholate siderophore receptor
MSLGDELSRGWLSASTDNASLGAVSFGLASVLLATGAAAQDAAKEEPTPLPPLEVTAKKAQAKKAAAKKAPAASPAPMPPPVEAEPVSDPVYGDGTTLTPSTGNTLQSGTGLGRLPGTLQDTPQTVNVITQRELQEKGVNTLDQALRAVPGVTVNVGEGGGGMNGDQFRIRGFQAKGDLYSDGLRDFGVYVRDSFAYEQVEVFKGPSSESFGMGTTGGAINLVQKTAHLGDTYNFEASIGTDDYYRAMVDINKQINATTAMRAVALYHDQEISDRDYLFSERFGFLGSLAFGLGTDTKLTVNYMHQDGERLPDFGVPIIDADGGGGPVKGKPVTEYGVPRSNFYGKETDLDDYSVDMVTARLTAKVSDALTIYNDTRLAWYSRYFAQTVPNCSGDCLDSVLDGSFSEPYGFGGPAGFDQDAWGAQNVTTAVAKFKTAWLRHELVAGVDVFYQEDDRDQLGIYDPNGNLASGDTIPSVADLKGGGTIGAPSFRNTTGYTVEKNPLALKSAQADNVGLFASDRVWLTDTFSILGGVRWDSYSAEYDTTDSDTGAWNPTVETDSDFTSPKLSVIWEPTRNQTYYASWAKSYSPVGQFITNDNNSVPTGENQNSADPEENELWEVGSKFSALDGRLGFTAALFRVEKGNSSYADPTTPGDVVVTGEEQRVQGVELGMTGSITDYWIVQAAYAYLDSEILYNPLTRNGSGDITALENQYKGNRVSFVPEHAVSLWTSYEISKFLPIDGKLLVGGGVTYSDGYYVNSANGSEIPSNFTFDAMASYELDGWRLALNGYNLSDELNYDAAIGNRAVVSPGRSAVFTIGKQF